MHQPALNFTPGDFAAEGHTPLMTQYMAVKAAHPGCIVFFRLGDFYEMFFEDAVAAARVLDIALTRRGKTQGADIPMCGVPAHAYEAYLAKLIRAGFRVAICDQQETPEEAKKRGGSKALVLRDVTRVVTPGTLTEETLLNARANNYLAALAGSRGVYGLAWIDLSTGAFYTQALDENDVAAALARIDPRELLAPQALFDAPNLDSILKMMGPRATPQAHSLFDVDNAARRLQKIFGVQTMDAFGAFTAPEIAAAGSLIDYAERTQKGAVPHLARPQQVRADDVLIIDPATRRNLELTETLSGRTEGSVLSTIDRTQTAAGARLLSSRLVAPARTLPVIADRQNRVAFFVEQKDLRETLRAQLKETPDLERATARIALNRAAPRDLAAVRDTLAAAEKLHRALNDAALPPCFTSVLTGLRQSPDCQALADTLSSALADTLPAVAADGGFIRAGYSAELDAQRGLRDDGRRKVVALQQKYARATNIDTLKIAYNNILGHYIEVSAKRADVLFAQADAFIHRQTMAGAVRFTTTELAALERDLAGAAERALAIELQIFRALQERIMAVRADLATLAQAIAEVDVASALADLAAAENWVRPRVTEDDDFIIIGGRHPVVEAALKAQGQHFIGNDADISAGRNLWLLTGPNMAGKSTFLRQNALLIILAQMGAFVPAASATIGLVDRVFSRVGAADDLAQGRSTFMVEMVETAAILHQATPRSFVILDEIGRGTATFDGLSIAWACLEYLHDVVKCRALFATHYHELTSLSARLPRLHGATMTVKEWQGEIVFLHAVADGAADRSYGLHVARLAGLPAAVTARAEEVLRTLEAGDGAAAVARLNNELPMFNAAPPAPAPSKHPVLDRLAAIDPDALSPKEALDELYVLKKCLS